MPSSIPEASVLPDINDVRAAAARLQGVAHRTPVLSSRTFNARTGAQVFFKCENLQRAGAFKFRGAYNALSQLTNEEKKRGVLTYSSGNHAQAIALAGSLLGVRTTIIMPNNAPQSKQEATRGYGAEVLLYDPSEQKREAMAAELNRERGMVVIPPYDHHAVVAGQGSAALELLDDVGELDLLLAPCGGGGLLGGSALAVKGTLPTCQVIGVEPELADDATRSFKSGELQTVNNPQTIADGLRTPFLGKITFPLVRTYVDDMITVSENEIVDMMRFLWTRMKLVVEPSGAVSGAPLLGKLPVRGKRVGVIISGGNVDLATASTLLQ